MILVLLPINPVLEIVLFCIAGVLVVGGIITGIVFLLLYKNRKKMYQQIDALLSDYIKIDSLKSTYERVNAYEYDYLLKTKTHVYYIMIIPNAKQLEIVINSPTKWLYRKGEDSTSQKYLPRVDRLMRFDPENEDNRIVKRLYIVYPAAKSLLRQINECEMEFVRPNTDINGTIVVTFNELKSYLNSMEN